LRPKAALYNPGFPLLADHLISDQAISSSIFRGAGTVIFLASRTDRR